ncbi:biopolymer transporter ExbD [Marinomonas sp. C2222]|uniref:Biopolymer transporter ExbD n=1 Tax=Marinomonas sargassi TaxID=2984494 RepID=A0ABT2YVX2_9GAMM|nr:biopolymer transporter ExbD [Marinomonas sargassi]MCV2404003.1 biopolymer transporter ExbD [Marinomonas sargassi]
MSLKLSQPKRKNAISLTPLIDVVFILLLFFMLTSSFTPWRTLDTPLSSPSTNTASEPKENITLTLKQNDGRVWLEEDAISVVDSSYFDLLVTNYGDSTFIVKAEEGVTLQSLMALADRLKLSGAEKVSIANAFVMPEQK